MIYTKDFTVGHECEGRWAGILYEFPASFDVCDDHALFIDGQTARCVGTLWSGMKRNENV